MSRFPIEVNGEPREAELIFGTARHAASLARWRPAAGGVTSSPIRDALEFARLASKRWRYYGRERATAASFDELRAMIRRDAKAEVTMILLARATWKSATPILGFAYVRRSWCNHLIVDFLSVHPRILDRTKERIRNVGTGLVHQLAALAEKLGAACVWG